MADAPSWEDRVQSQDSRSTETSMDPPRQERETSPSLMGSLIFCTGGVASEDAKSTINSLRAESSHSCSNTNSLENKSSDRKSRYLRKPLQSTDVLNKGLSQELARNPLPNPGGCFPDFPNTFGSFLKRGKVNRCNCVGTCGGCGSCWDSHSNTQLVSSFRQAQASPARESTSIPVIEALGVTPKSKDRLNKYSVSGSGAMNPAGNSIPTPAPRKKKYTPAFNDIPESITARASLKDKPSSLKEGSSNEDAFLPDDFAETKENAKMYTEADLQDALALQEKEFASKIASKSEDSELSQQQQLQEQLEQQLEQQGLLWNKDLEERLEANRSHYKKKQSAMKARITELELQSQTLQKSQEEDRVEYQKQTDELRLELTNCRQANNIERDKLLEQVAKKTEELSKLEEKSKASQQEPHCTPGFIRDLQQKVRTLQNDREECEKRATLFEKQVINLEGSLSNHTSALAACKDGRKVDQRKIVEVETRLERATKANADLLEENQGLKNQLKSLDQDDKTPHTLMRIQTCIQTLSAHDANSIATSPSDERGSIDLTLDHLETAVTETVRRLVVAEATTKCAVDARVEAELEAARLTDVTDGNAKDASNTAVQSYWEQKAVDTPQREGENREVLQSEALTLLMRDIQSLQRLCKMEDGPAKDLLEDYAAELHKKVEQISEELQRLQHHLLKRSSLEIPPGRINTSVSEQSNPTRKSGEASDLLLQVADLEAKLADTNAALSQKEKALANLEQENSDTLRALGSSEERVQRLGGGNYTSSLKGEETQVEEILVLLAMKEEVDSLKQAKDDFAKKCEALVKALEEGDEETESLKKDKKEMGDQLEMLTEKCDTLSKALDEQKADAASLNRERGELMEKCNALTKSLEEKDNKLVVMARDKTKGSLEQSFLQNKLASILAFIERSDERSDDDDEKEFPSLKMEMEANPDDLDSFQKLDRIEQHLWFVWKEFAQKISSQRELLAGMQEKITELRSDSDRRVLQLQSDLGMLKGELSAALEDASNTHEAHEKLKAEKDGLSEQVTALETQLESANREMELGSAAELELARADCKKLEDDLGAAKSESSKLTIRILELESLLETNGAECERLDRLVSQRTDIEELLQKSAELEEKSNATIQRCEVQVRQVREEHAKEIDELLSQLDLVEAEHREDCCEKEKTLKGKDAIIAALGAQLAESQGSIISLEDASANHTLEMEKARGDILKAQQDALALKAEFEKLQATYADFQENREAAIEAAREETIQEATVQFENFNALYRTMTANYKSAASKVQELEAELVAAKNLAEEVAKDHASTIASINSDLAELKATQAREDAAAARTLKEYQEVERGLKTRLSEAEMSNRSVQKLLATVVAEKEELFSENEELRSVCEEAMSLAETTHS